MKLFELFGYHKFKDLTLDEIIEQLYADNRNKFRQGSGAFAITIIPEDKPFIYKVWYEDAGYEKFIKVIQELQGNPFVPKMIGKPRKLPVFFKRPKEIDGYLKIVKLEKLNDLDTGRRQEKRLVWLVRNLIDYCVNEEDELRALEEYADHERPNRASIVGRMKQAEVVYAKRSNRGHYQGNTRARDRTIINLRKTYAHELASDKVQQNVVEHFKHLVKVTRKLRDLVQRSEAATDVHSGNIMLRGSFPVIVDPLVGDNWESSNTIRMPHLLGSESLPDNLISHETDKVEDGEWKAKKRKALRGTQDPD